MTYCIGTMLMYWNKLPIWSLFQMCARSLLFPTTMNLKKKIEKKEKGDWLEVRKKEKSKTICDASETCWQWSKQTHW